MPHGSLSRIFSNGAVQGKTSQKTPASRTRRAILVAADSIDATDELTARIDAEIGAGPQAPPGTDSATDGGGQGAPNPANAPADQGAASPAEQAPVPAPPAQGQ